jgi:glycosyltransferase involved in cell wall biosynthesis
VKRVLILIKGLGRGGAEQLIASSARYWDRSQFEYEVAYVLPWKNALVPEIERLGIRVSCLQGKRSFSWLANLRSLINRGGFDVVHAHSPVAAAAARATVGISRPVIYTEHNVWERYHRATLWANLLTYPRNRHVFTVSDHVRDSIRYPALLRFRKMPSVETLYHGIDPQEIEHWSRRNGIRKELGIPEEAFVVGTVANFKHHKGYPQLMKAAAEVVKFAPDVRFVLVGNGPIERDIKAQARRLGLEGSVVFAGYREDAPRVSSAFDVFALASVYEGLSIALIEAMALGKPAVVTNVGGLPEVVENGRQGLVVPPEDPKHFAAALLALWRNRGLRQRLGEGAVARASFFDIRKAVQRQEAVYQEVLA